MADNVIVTIQLPPDDGSGSVVAGQTTAQKLTPAEQRAQGAAKAVKGMVSYASVRAFASNIISYEISQVSLRTGAKEYEQKLRFGYDVANKLLNVATATAVGAQMGGIIGAAVGFVGSTVYTAIGYMQAANTLRTRENLENISIGMANLRAGASGRRSSKQ